jgi:hypothetical protein
LREKQLGDIFVEERAKKIKIKGREANLRDSIRNAREANRLKKKKCVARTIEAAVTKEACREACWKVAHDSCKE